MALLRSEGTPIVMSYTFSCVGMSLLQSFPLYTGCVQFLFDSFHIEPKSKAPVDLIWSMCRDLPIFKEQENSTDEPV